MIDLANRYTSVQCFQPNLLSKAGYDHVTAQNSTIRLIRFYKDAPVLMTQHEDFKDIIDNWPNDYPEYVPFFTIHQIDCNEVPVDICDESTFTSGTAIIRRNIVNSLFLQIICPFNVFVRNILKGLNVIW